MRIVVPTTQGMLEMAENAVDSIRSVGLTAELHMLQTYTDEIDNEYADYATDRFRPIMIKKLELILQVLKGGDTILLVDADIGFYKNPIPYLEQFSHDVVIQSDSANLDYPNMLYCTGFFLARPRPAVIELFETCMKLMQNGSPDDQQAFNEAIASRNDINLHRLCDRRFPNGSIWRKYRPAEAFLVHANYVIGWSNKVEMLNEAGLYGGGHSRLLRALYRRYRRTCGDLRHYSHTFQIYVSGILGGPAARFQHRAEWLGYSSRLGDTEVYGVFDDGWISREALIIPARSSEPALFVIKLESQAPAEWFPLTVSLQSLSGAVLSEATIDQPGEFELKAEYPLAGTTAINAPVWIRSDKSYVPHAYSPDSRDIRQLSVILQDVSWPAIHRNPAN